MLLKETMSGSLTLHRDGIERPFAFTIHAFTRRIFSLRVPRFFHGTVRYDGASFPCQGELTIRLTGPHYWLEFAHPELGWVRAEGSTQYGRNGLINSLITCPLTVSANGRPLGHAQVAYRDSKLAFPFQALRLVPEARAYKGATGQ